MRADFQEQQVGGSMSTGHYKCGACAVCIQVDETEFIHFPEMGFVHIWDFFNVG